MKLNKNYKGPFNAEFNLTQEIFYLFPFARL